MASIIKISDGKYRAQIRRVGHPKITETFTRNTDKDAKKAATDWAANMEREIDQGKRVGIHGMTGIKVSDAFARFIEEKPDTVASLVSAMRSMSKSECMGDIMLSKLTEENIVDYIESKEFSAASGAFHFSALGSMMKRAKIVWKYHVPEIMKSTQERLSYEGLIGKSKNRERRPTDNELQLLLNYKYPKKFPMAEIIRFAIASGMRCAEITRIERSTYQDRTIVITDRKHPTKKEGNHKIVPLLDDATAIINRQLDSHDDPRVFPYRSKYISEVFIATCKALGIEDLHFHDFRHEATSRLFEMGYQPVEVQQFTGHEDLNMLMRYTHLKAKDIRRIEPIKVQESAPMEMDADMQAQFKMFLAMQAMMKKQAEQA